MTSSLGSKPVHARASGVPNEESCNIRVPTVYAFLGEKLQTLLSFSNRHLLLHYASQDLG